MKAGTVQIRDDGHVVLACCYELRRLCFDIGRGDEADGLCEPRGDRAPVLFHEGSGAGCFLGVAVDADSPVAEVVGPVLASSIGVMRCCAEGSPMSCASSTRLSR
jgi:hypothetical protein